MLVILSIVDWTTIFSFRYLLVENLNQVCFFNFNLNTNPCHRMPTRISEKPLSYCILKQIIHAIFMSYTSHVVNSDAHTIMHGTFVGVD